MSKRPGGELAARPLHFFWICDNSGSMSIDGKIQSLNVAIREATPHMRQVADENPSAHVMVRCLKFSHGAEWHIPPTPLDRFNWVDLAADPMQGAKPTIDIVFMIDTSGSMSGEIKGVKASCVAFADKIIAEGANVRLGLVGFGIGNPRLKAENHYTIHRLSTYTIGISPLTTPEEFKKNISTLSIRLFGGLGCYLANTDTVDIFPHVVNVFQESPNPRALVIITDEIGDKKGLPQIVNYLKNASITTHVMGVAREGGAHQSLAAQTGGKFWDIFKAKANFDELLINQVAPAVAQEAVKQMANGVVSAGTDMGTALNMVADELRIPPMAERALPPVLVLVSDGQPTDDFEAGLKALMALPWGKKAVRLGIAIGKDADLDVLKKFIGNVEIPPLLAQSPEALVRYIKWASTAVLKSASAPASQLQAPSGGSNIPIPDLPTTIDVNEVW